MAVTCSFRDGRFNCGTNTDIMTRTIRDVKAAGGVVMLIETKDMPYCRGDGDIPDEMFPGDEALLKGANEFILKVSKDGTMNQVGRRWMALPR